MAQTNYSDAFSLSPISFWKWVLVVLLLLGMPFFILLNQISASFLASRDQKVSEFELEVEKISGRALAEQNTQTQLDQVLHDYYARVEELYARRYILQTGYAREIAWFGTSTDLVKNFEIAKVNRQISFLEKRLRNLVPGIKMLKWDHNFTIEPDSDGLLPRFVYQKLFEAIRSRIRTRRTDEQSDSDYYQSLALVKKYFCDDPFLRDLIKFGDLHRLTTTSGPVQYVAWREFTIAGELEIKISSSGMLIIVPEDGLPDIFGLTLLSLRKAFEWEKSGYALGWVDAQNPRATYLPYPFSVLDRQFWQTWLPGRPNGVYEQKNLLLSIKHVNSRLILVAGKSLKDENLFVQKQIFQTHAIFILFSALMLLLLGFSRKNAGVGLSIKWQVLCLFIMAMALPVVAAMHFGVELLRDRRQFYENQGFKRLEKIKRDIEENHDYVVKHLERLGEDLSFEIQKFYRPDSGKKPFVGDGLEKLIDKYTDMGMVQQLYLFDAAGEEVLKYKIDDGERRGLLPLVTSLAKLKLRLSGKLVQEGYSGAVSLMDLMLEETGGAKMAYIEHALKSSRSSIIELKFTDRRTFCFVGQISPEADPNKVYILAFIIRDKKFDQVYLELMIDKLQNQKNTARKIQLFYGKNRFASPDYFITSNIQTPFFDYKSGNEDSISLGKMTEPTRFAGISVRDSFVLQNGRRYLVYSFLPAGLENFCAMLLLDYSEITDRLESLRVLLFVIILVTLMVVYTLAKITARSLVEPVILLKKAVERVEEQDYSCRVIFPGADELVDLSSAINRMTQGLDERRKMMRYLSKSAVEAVKTRDGIELGGRRVPATILFSDIRGFTTISETNEAEVVVSLLNDYFAGMNQVIEAFDGDIDKFIGDAIMAQFVSRSEKGFSPADMALKAVRCSLEMMNELRRFNQKREKAGKFAIMIGVGINSGEVIAGNIGSPGRMDHTVIGDTVNVASRLEGMSKLGRHSHVIISRSTLELVKEHVIFEQLRETSVKGKSSAVEMFEVISCDLPQLD